MRCWVCLVVVAGLAGVARADDVELPTVMDHRWSIFAGLGGGVLGAQASGAEAFLAGSADFGLRFRIDPEIEVGGILTGASGGPTDDQASYLGLLGEGRYRFYAEHEWNTFVGLGVGFGTTGDGAHLVGRLSVGLERRFEQAAISLSGRATGVFSDNPDSVVDGGNAYEFEKHGAWDASAVLGFHYYWGRGRQSRALLSPERPRR